MGKYAKALVGAAIAGLGALQVALDEGITAKEAVGCAIVTLVTFAGVWRTPNTPTTTTSIVDQPGQPTTVITTETDA